MADKLEMSLRMYSDYETGKYDKSKGDVRRLKILKKIETIKAGIANIKPGSSADLEKRIIELEKENAFLHRLIDEKQQVIEDRQRTISWLEHFINSNNKSIVGSSALKKN